MAGHSKWANIQHRKAAVDKRRGVAWSKLARNIISAARQGGGDPEANLKLKYAIDKARAANMPKDTIERNIKKGTGELEGETLEELVYEGYGAGGVAVLVEALTDNRNRTAPEMRRIFEKNGGNLGTQGSVVPFFVKKAVFRLAGDAADEDRLLELVLEAGAEDLKNEGESFEITAEPREFSAVQQALEGAGIPLQSAEISYIPLSTVPLDSANARRVLKMLEQLEENEDVQNLASNFEISDEVMAEIAADA